MKTTSLKIIMAALLFAVGTLGLSAQGMRGGGMGGNGGNGGLGGGHGMGGTGTGSGNYLTLLTPEQKVILQNLNDAFQTEMTALSIEMKAATTLADRITIMNEMNTLRVAHIKAVNDQLLLWNINVTVGTGGMGLGLGNMMGTGRHRGRRG